MHYFQIEFEAHDRQEKLLREARERRLSRALKSRKRNDGVFNQLRVHRFVGFLWREPGNGVGRGIVEDGELIPGSTEQTKTASTA